MNTRLQFVFCIVVRQIVVLPESRFNGEQRGYGSHNNSQEFLHCNESKFLVDGDLQAVAIHREHGLDRLDGHARVAASEEAAVADRRRRNPVTNALLMEVLPAKSLAGIELASRSDI